MPKSRPPQALPRRPRRQVLTAGTLLFRIHAAAREATAFNPVPADCLYGGGRFDATRCDPYGYLYAGLSVEAAVCETLLRSVPFEPSAAPRLLPRRTVRGRRLSVLRLARDVEVVPLVSGRDLAAVAQDAWLVQAEAADYPYTRDWGHWIRARTGPAAQGFLWPSKREPADRALVLFSDRCPADALRDAGVPPLDLDTPEGESWLNTILEGYHAAVAPAP
ncbi:RES family NAD+ phosphorylase [Streptomyces sp. DSM 44917]|uniref:RES family NAD+ phosphorylase n=1 Tax=Streptomyces boetiae TaxID=3075541 RepID=A0ABU2LCF7_9ACTN|nr:RES family NAD+ phosphorylase [Streptomyces sp. DSM 44917]MDT0309250.1 RES family NAD+ phosphorylase [Streptomyces sp. DSM 44917]